MNKSLDSRELRRGLITKHHQERQAKELRSRHIYIKDAVVVDILKHRGHFGNKKENPNVIEAQKIFSDLTVAGRVKCRKYMLNCELAKVHYQLYKNWNESKTIIIIPALMPGSRHCRCHVSSVDVLIEETEKIIKDMEKL